MKKILIADDENKWTEYHSKIVNTILGECEIFTVNSATEGYQKIIENNEKPFDIVITDMQMENSYTPLYAGEWLIEQIQTLKTYLNTKIVIISATYNIDMIAQKYNVDYIRKYVAVNDISAYDILK